MVEKSKKNNKVKVFSIEDETGWAIVLTERDVTILQLLSTGTASKEIAKCLFISPHTLKNVISRILNKIDAKNRTHAVVKAYKAGLIK